MSELPPCGLYRTTSAIGPIPADRLVYFHNHGDPGAGVYFPEKWAHNRATFSPKGTTVPEGFNPGALMPLPVEGFYRVTSEFHCCAKHCVHFEPDMLIQLGYNGNGKPILFQPELAGGAIGVPERGTPIDDDKLVNLTRLKLSERELRNDLSLPRGIVVH